MEQQVMQTLFLLLLIGLVPLYTQQTKCSYKPASVQDEPHGANEVVEYKKEIVREIKGQVIYRTGEPVPDLVVEVYKAPARSEEMSTYQLTRNSKRKAACITGKDGRFCFNGLPSGEYALRVGTREQDAMNEAYQRVKLDRRITRSRELEIVLTPGT
jgi:protocatechuate 3,4-dioxygenase beta subunit